MRAFERRGRKRKRCSDVRRRRSRRSPRRRAAPRAPRGRLPRPRAMRLDGSRRCAGRGRRGKQAVRWVNEMRRPRRSAWWAAGVLWRVIWFPVSSASSSTSASAPAALAPAVENRALGGRAPRAAGAAAPSAPRTTASTTWAGARLRAAGCGDVDMALSRGGSAGGVEVATISATGPGPSERARVVVAEVRFGGPA